MVNTNKLKGIIAERAMSQQDVARMLGITPKTFYNKMKSGVFNSDEMMTMVEELHIEDPAAIFFAKELT